MKAHIPTKREIERKLEVSEINRINKLWLYTLGQFTDITHKKSRELYAAVCEVAGRVYEDPELWIRVDEYCSNKLKFGDVFPAEDYDEREKVAAQIHKEHGKKWRKY